MAKKSGTVMCVEDHRAASMESVGMKFCLNESLNSHLTIWVVVDLGVNCALPTRLEVQPKRQPTQLLSMENLIKVP